MDPTPLYRRLASHYREAIEAGTLTTGDRFPSMRALMTRHDISLSTAVQVCRQLESDGWLEARPRSGNFVRQPLRGRRNALSEPSPGQALDPAAITQAADASIRAMMLVRTFRVRGHLAADLDPLGLTKQEIPADLTPEYHGFAGAALDQKVYLGGVLGFEWATVRELVETLRKNYCGQVGLEYMHIADVEERRFLQERIEGQNKVITFTPEGKKAILGAVIRGGTPHFDFVAAEASRGISRASFSARWSRIAPLSNRRIPPSFSTGSHTAGASGTPENASSDPATTAVVVLLNATWCT